MSVEELMDLFQRPLYDIQRAWRAPLFRIVQRLSQGILQGSPEDEERCALAFRLGRGMPLWEVDPSGGALSFTICFHPRDYLPRLPQDQGNELLIRANSIDALFQV